MTEAKGRLTLDDIRSRIEQIAGEFSLASENDEPLGELIERVRWELDEALAEFEGHMLELKEELDGLETEAEEQMEEDQPQ